MKAIVTGCAGFLGSSLSKELVHREWNVLGIDNFLDYYPRTVKEKNLAPLKHNNQFKFIEGDVSTMDMEEHLEDVNAVFHLAAQAGVRSSWGSSFEIYTHNNILATQRLLEAAKNKNLKFIFASSSSVYGETRRLPMRENDLTRPYSPYGVSKLAAENLCLLYNRNYRLDTVALRLFTIYGPGQRPDMAFHRFIKAIVKDTDLEIFGDGEQTRDFTYVSDVVHAFLLAFDKGRPGGIYNIAGGSRITLNRAIEILEELTSKKAMLKYAPRARGDMAHTFAAIDRASKELGYRPHVKLDEGLRKQIEWLKNEPG